MKSLRLVICMIFLFIAAQAHAADYPAKPVRIVVAYPAGGTDDLHARLIAEKLTQFYGKQFIVDNRPSAGGVLAFDLVSRAVPDGYTLLLAGANLTIVPHLREHVTFNIQKDFTPVSQISSFQLMMVTHPSVPARSVKELITLARAHPGKLNFASSGVGATPHLSFELFKHMARVDITHIPYKGGAIPDVIAGRVELYIGTMPGVAQPVRDGKLRALGVTGARRAPLFPAVPTIAESGLPGYEVSSWYGIFAPAGISHDVLASLNASIRKAIAMPDVAKRLSSIGAEPSAPAQDEFVRIVQESHRKFGRIIKDAGIKAD